MSDPIERLDHFRTGFEPGPMPLSADEVRRRGDRLRRRNAARVATAGVVAAVVVAAPIIAVATHGAPGDVQPVHEPTVTPLGAEYLLTGKDAIYPNGAADWETVSTELSDGEATANPCQQQAFVAGLGASSVASRTFRFVSATGEVEPSFYLTELIGEFESPAAAQQASDEVRAWFASDVCQPAGAQTYHASDGEPVPIGVDGQAEELLSIYGPVDRRLDPTGDSGWFLDTGLVLSGDRIAMLSQVTWGQDYDWPEGSPVRQMLPAAADRLVDGGGTSERSH